MKNPFFERRCRYSIRKLSVGACSLMIGAVLFAGPALAEETAVPENNGANTALVSGESEHPTNEADKQHEGEHARENKPEKAEGVATASETALPASNEAATTETAEAVSAAKPEEKASEVAAETPSAEAKPKSDKETEAKPEGTSQGDESKPAAEANKTEKEVQPDVPKNTEKILKPKEIKFNSWEDLLKWEPGAREDDPINRSSVELAKRHRGQLVNEKASRRAKVQALANTNSKAKDHASVGGEEFKAYAFDYWQYLDSMVFWEGLVPTPDVIDAGHRNGVPVYGTLFFNWSNSIADQEKFVAALKQDEDGTFPIARKLVDLAKYYGFDGYFINQETTGELVAPLGEKMRQFMLYTKEYAAKVNHPIKYTWYDAMTYKYGRYHEDGLGDYNYQFMQKEGDKVPADQFFANFNWNKEKNDHSVEMAKWLERSQYDVFAGLELQQGGSYKTKVKWDALLDEKGKLRLSLGLFAPDTITSLEL